jgi:hypothetical protein
MSIPDRSTYESIYAGQPPWDIGKAQKAIIDVADKITGSILDAGYRRTFASSSVSSPRTRQRGPRHANRGETFAVCQCPTTVGRNKVKQRCSYCQ